MPTYSWSGINNHGKKISGFDQADNKDQLKTKLINQNVFPLKITRNFACTFHLYHPIKNRDVIYFIEQLAILLNANTPIVKALEIISQDEQSTKMKNLLGECKKSISDGKSLYLTLNQYPQYFNELLRNLINVGEQSGTLDIMLQEVANHFKKIEIQKHKTIKALLYPITILVVTLAVTAILLIFVIPQFETMFNNFGAKIPGYTRSIIDLSNFLQATWKIILALVIGITVCTKIFYHHSIKFRLLLDKFNLNIPLVKSILTYATISRFTKTLSLTLKAGIPLLVAINISNTTIANHQYRLAIQNAIKPIANGQPLHRSLYKQNLFPTKVIQLIMLGEETGALDSMLEKISTIYNEELNHIVDNLNNLLEPMVMLILGILVGGLVIGMYLPIFRLGTII